MSRVSVKPEMLRWACERSGQGVETLRKRSPKIEFCDRGAELLDKNQLYVNLCEIDDAQFKVSKEDKELHWKFYGE